jgi:uncharacterized protein YidB (DUF937 family)
LGGALTTLLKYFGAGRGTTPSPLAASEGGGELAGITGNLVGAFGGLGGLVTLLERGGLGDAVQSWVGTGGNQPISAEQITQALGQEGHLQTLAATIGVSSEDAAKGLAALLPEVIHQLTPDAQVSGQPLNLEELAQKFLSTHAG